METHVSWCLWMFFPSKPEDDSQNDGSVLALKLNCFVYILLSFEKVKEVCGLVCFCSNNDLVTTYYLALNTEITALRNVSVECPSIFFKVENHLKLVAIFVAFVAFFCHYFSGSGTSKCPLAHLVKHNLHRQLFISHKSPAFYIL